MATLIDDTSSGVKIDAYAVAYSGLNQVQNVTESLVGAEKKATSYTYDPYGQSETANNTVDYTYYPADRLTKWAKTGNGAGTETYVHDDNANVVSQTVKGTRTAFHYDRNRLLTATTSGVTRVLATSRLTAGSSNSCPENEAGGISCAGDNVTELERRRAACRRGTALFGRIPVHTPGMTGGVIAGASLL